MRTEEAIRLVTAARTDADLFGTEAPARRYRELVGALHPRPAGRGRPGGYAPPPPTRSSQSPPGGAPPPRCTPATSPTCTTTGTGGC
nr:hypothetical protein [Micromonospora provocatoris]